MIHLDYRDAQPIYGQIVEGIKAQIAGDVLRPGDRLPSVRELAMQLTINPNTIQRAYRQLESEGFIATVAGKGCFVCEQTAPHRRLGRDALMKTLEETAAALLEMGMTRAELADLILQGGNDNA